MSEAARAWLLPGSALALAAGMLLGRVSPLLWPGLAALGCGVCAAVLLRRRGRMAAIWAAVCAFGCAAGQIAWHPALPDEGNYLVTGIVTEELRFREDGQVRTILRNLTLDGKAVSGGGYWTFYLREDGELPTGLAPGVKVALTGKVYHPGDAQNPGGYSFRESMLQQGVKLGVYGVTDCVVLPAPFYPAGMAAAMREALSRRLVAFMGPEAGGYAAAMVLGSRSLLPEEDQEAFNHLGIAHILSVSGFHVGVLAGLIRLLLRRLHLSRRLRLGITCAALACYCLLTGGHAPVVRAALLYLLWECGMLLHRPRSGLHLLCAAWCIILLFDPTQLTSGSFLLTFGAMLGLTLVTPWLQKRCTFSARWKNKTWGAISAALGAQAGILLPQLYCFHELPVLSVPLNLAVATLAGGVIALCWGVLLLLPIAPLAQMLGSIASVVIHLLLQGVRALGSSPALVLWTCQANALTALGWAAMLFASSMWWRWRRRLPVFLLGAAVLTLSLVPLPHHGTEYMQLSMGEADAAILLDEDTVAVIDVGENGSALSSYLHQQRLDVDMLIITHLHRDHAGGLRALLDDHIPVQTCYLPWGAEAAAIDEGMLPLLKELTARGTELIHLGRGDVLPLPSGKLTVLWPEDGRVRPGQEANESSLAMLLEAHGGTMLLTGDLDGVYENYAAVPADVLKVPHHGSAGSTLPPLIEKVSPQAMILSRGDETRRISMDERRGGIPLYDTEADGAVTVRFRPEGITVETWR